MIILLLSVNYTISAGRMEIVNMEKRIFLDTVVVRSGDFFLRSLFGIETRNQIEVGGGVFVRNKNTSFLSDRGYYYRDSGRVLGIGNITLTKGNLMFSGDTIVYYPERDTGWIKGHFFFGSDSLVVNGKKGFFTADSLVVKERPITMIDSTRILSERLTYIYSDSTGIFNGDVEVLSGGVKGRCDRLVYLMKGSMGKAYNAPVFFTERDTVSGDSGYIYFDENRAVVFDGDIVSRLEDGVNHVKGDRIHFYYTEGRIDSVVIDGNPEGDYLTNGTESEGP